MRWLLCVTAFLAGVVYAQPITIITSSGPGSASDSAARFFAKEITQHTERPVVVKPVVGADGLLALQAFLASPPDNTLLMGNTNLSAIAAKTEHAQSVDRLVPVVGTFTYDMVLIASKASGVTDAAGLIKLSKSRTLLGAGSGSFSTAIFRQVDAALGTKTEAVTYRDKSQQMIDLANGATDYAAVGVFNPGFRAMLQQGKVTVIASMDAMRSSEFPEVRTLAEQGHAPLYGFAWTALMLQPDASPVAKEYFGHVLRKIGQSAAARSYAVETNQRVWDVTSAEIQRTIRAEQRFFQ